MDADCDSRLVRSHRLLRMSNVSIHLSSSVLLSSAGLTSIALLVVVPTPPTPSSTTATPSFTIVASRFYICHDG